MKFKIFWSLLLSLVLVSCSSSQNMYIVQSIKDLPVYNCFLIKVCKADDTLKINEIWIISDYTEKQVFEKPIKINEGMSLAQLNLMEIAESENPFKTLIQSNRKGNQAIYIDGELLYDPKINLYSSICIKGLFYNLECR